ncbi:hypothetical protein [Stenotrophomonas maltophilia]|uniref:hypothetical protein n=1 Tax=Stenotrophomonas maltophilia TaxID=40324 RepID=UPI0015DDE17F|nr:hypothetical protein [Stenotrophomonas maltophilia]MBA0283831.1 hypothetical protein [Stenotrophomonas maltophilia]MBA0324138.1 hypothetical protein [Stenotrophomonas maltophilia]
MSSESHTATVIEPGRPGSTYSDGPAWHAFGLSRAAYLVLPRRTLQSMPLDWQARFVALIQEARRTLPDEAFPQYQAIRLKDGQYAADPNCRYRRMPPFPHRPTEDAPARCDAPLAGAFVNTFTQFDQATQ